MYVPIQVCAECMLCIAHCACVQYNMSLLTQAARRTSGTMELHRTANDHGISLEPPCCFRYGGLRVPDCIASGGCSNHESIPPTLKYHFCIYFGRPPPPPFGLTHLAVFSSSCLSLQFPAPAYDPTGSHGPPCRARCICSCAVVAA